MTIANNAGELVDKKYLLVLPNQKQQHGRGKQRSKTPRRESLVRKRERSRSFCHTRNVSSRDSLAVMDETNNILLLN